ncbi:hypothetical protein O6H91_13G043400 [Diphasiastrum complanatum]|uniref:Uncharacterized protein n=2 Tax=Diphasiastrum complanatum TaxID=34168 RepID=A0ACC2BU99_DIPCM|nr:hypothetical protein O6H91_13G043400 [Diphasiastrum complanatum]KAJ7533328.1 hypothetical protein O6H91_13G043400 [Diphasiastrum complanatum]
MEKLVPEMESTFDCRRETIQNATRLYGVNRLDGITNLNVGENIAPSVSGKNIRQGRIIDTLSSSCNTYEACEELGYLDSSDFTIRGYVSYMRQKSIRKNWPFSERSFKQHHDKADGPLLPPFEPQPLYCPTSEVGLGQEYATETVIGGTSTSKCILSQEVRLHLELDGEKGKDDGDPHEPLMQCGLGMEERKQLLDINGEKTESHNENSDVCLRQKEETSQMPKEAVYHDFTVEEDSEKMRGKQQHGVEREHEEVLVDTMSPTIEREPEVGKGQLEELTSHTKSLFVSKKQNSSSESPCDAIESTSQQSSESKSVAIVASAEQIEGGLSETHDCRKSCEEAESNIDFFSPNSCDILDMKLNVDLTTRKNASSKEPHTEEMEQKIPKQKGKIQKTRLITDIISSHPALVQEEKHFGDRQPLKSFTEKSVTRCPLSNQQHAIYRKNVASTKLARARRLKYGISRKDSFVHSKCQPGKRKHHRLDADKFHSVSEHPSKRNCVKGEHPFRKELVRTRNRRIRSTFNHSLSIANCAEVSSHDQCITASDPDHRVAYVDKGLTFQIRGRLNSGLSAARDYENLRITEEDYQSEHHGEEQKEDCVDPFLRLNAMHCASPLEPANLSQLNTCEDLCVSAIGKRIQPSPKLNVAWWPPVAMVRNMVDSVPNTNSIGTIERISRRSEVQPVCLSNTECEMTDRSTSSLESSQIVLETNESLEVSDSESMQYRDQSEHPLLERTDNRSKEYFEARHFHSDRAQPGDISSETNRQSRGKSLWAPNIECQKGNPSLSDSEKVYISDFHAQSRIDGKLDNVHEPSVQVQTNQCIEQQSSISGSFHVDANQSFIGQAGKVGNSLVGTSCQTTPEQMCAFRTKEASEDFQSRTFSELINLQISTNTTPVHCSPCCLPHNNNKKPSDTNNSDARVNDLCISTENVEIAEQNIGLKYLACKVLHALDYGAAIPSHEPVIPIFKSNKSVEHENISNGPKLSWKAAVVMATMGAHLGVNFAGLLSKQPNSSTAGFSFLPPRSTNSQENCDGAGDKSTTVGCVAANGLLRDCRSYLPSYDISYVPSDQSARDLATGTRLDSEHSAGIFPPDFPSCSSDQDTKITGSAVNILTVPTTTIMLPTISSGKESLAAPKGLDQTPKSRLSASNISVAMGDRVLRTFPRGLPPGRYSVNADGARCLEEGSKLKVITSEAICEKDISTAESAVLSLSGTSQLQQKKITQGVKFACKNILPEKVLNADPRDSLGQDTVPDCSTMDFTDLSNMGKPMLRLMGKNVMLSSRCNNEQEQCWQYQKQQNGVQCAISGPEGTSQSIEYALTPAMNNSSLKDVDNASHNSRVHPLFVPGSSQLSNCTTSPGNNAPELPKVPHFSYERQEHVELIRFNTCSGLKLPNFSVQEQRDSLAGTHIQAISGNNLHSEHEVDNLIINNMQTCRTPAISASNLFQVRRNDSQYTVLKQKVSPSIETFGAQSFRGSENSSILDVGLGFPVTKGTENVGLSLVEKVSSTSALYRPSRMKGFPHQLQSDSLLSPSKAVETIPQPSGNHSKQNMQLPQFLDSRNQKEAYLAANVIEIEDDDEVEPSSGITSNSHKEQLSIHKLGLQASLKAMKHADNQKVSNRVNHRLESGQVDFLPTADLSSLLAGVGPQNCRNGSISGSGIENMRLLDADQINADASNQEKTSRKRCQGAGKIKLTQNSELKLQQESLSKWRPNTTSSKGFPGPLRPNWISGINSGIKRGATANFFKARVEMMKAGRATQNLAQFPSGRLDTSTNMANACSADHHKAPGSGSPSYLPISVPQSNVDYYDFLSRNSDKDSALNDLVRVPSPILEARNPFIGTGKNNFICQEQFLVPSLSVAESLQNRSRQILMSQRPPSNNVARNASNQINSNLLQRSHYTPGSDILGTEYDQRRLPTSNNNSNDLQMIAGALDYPFYNLVPYNSDIFHAKPVLVQKYQDRLLQRVGETRNSESLSEEMCPLGFASTDQLLAYQLQRRGHDYGKHLTADYCQQRKRVKRNSIFRPIPPVP